VVDVNIEISEIVVDERKIMQWIFKGVGNVLGKA
jgi:hypothetical protein